MIYWQYNRALSEGTTAVGIGTPALVVLDGKQQQVICQLPAGDQEWCVVDLRSGKKIAPITQQHLRDSIPETVAAALAAKLSGLPAGRVSAVLAAAPQLNGVPTVL